MGAMIRDHAWKKSPLGAPTTWPQSLKTLVSLMLGASQPMFIIWGPDRVWLNNDAMIPLMGTKHPRSLGQHALDKVWSEAREALAPLFATVFAGTPVRMDDIALELDRHGRPEEAHFAFSYTPVRGDDGEIGGLFGVCTDTTAIVLADRTRGEEIARQREQLRQMPGFVAILDGPTHVFQYVNDAYITIAGPRDYIGRGVREVFPELEGQPFYGLLDDVYLEGEAFFARSIPVQLTGEGEERFIDLLYQPIRNTDGAVTGIFVAGYDVTEARRALALLHQRERHLAFLDHLARETQKLEDADTILATTTELVGKHMGVSVCAYADMDEDQDGFTIRGDWAASGSTGIRGHYSLADFGKLAVKNLSAGQPLIINDNLKEIAPEEAATFQAIGISATICMPLVKNGRLTALMAVHHKEPHNWTDDELQLISEVTERSWAHVERVRAEADLRNSEQRYRALFDAIDEGFCIIEFIDGPHGPLNDYIHIEANEAYATHAGIPNVVGQKVREMVGAEAEEWVRLYKGVLDTGKAIRFERELEATGRWLELAAFRIEPKERNQVAVLFQDLTARKTSEIAMRHSEERFRVLTRVMPNQAWTAAPNGDLDWFNDRVYDYSGTAVGALDGTQWGTIVHPDDIASSSARWVAALKSGDLYETEFRLRRADGEYRWHIARAVPIKDDTGRVLRWIGTNTDVHDQKTINETLEHRVEERTRQLMQAEEALRQAQKMEAVGQLTGGLAHDFNNLLAGISGSLELLAKRMAEGRTAGLERYLSGAQESARRAASLTQRLLAFSRRQTLDPRPLDINKLVSGMADLVRRSVGPTIELEVVHAGGLWTTRIDGPQLENALLNLCINARDAMAPKGGRLTIETANKWLDERAARERDLPPGQYVSLCVTDTGSGMAQETIDRAFDPFFTTKPLGQGTGLGLSMVYGFARQSGGQVRIYSEVGVGTTMCLYFPRHFGEADERDTAQDAAAVERGEGEIVLVVDDEVLLRMLMVDVLQDNGYRALEAVDGPSALKILESDARIDLLITDVGLPGGVNGRQVADAARRTRPDLKVMFITGYAENAVVGNGHLSPGMEILTKPFEIAAFGQKVRDMIDRG